LPRHLRHFAYENRAIQLEVEGSSVSQPSVVALMLKQLTLTGEEKVLEIGTGSGYNARLLEELAAEVHTVEFNLRLVERARRNLRRTGSERVFVHKGDGALGDLKHAPFDAIIVTAATTEIPSHLVDQLKIGGRMVLPVETRSPYADTLIVNKLPEGFDVINMGHSVDFHPLISQHSGGWVLEK